MRSWSATAFPNDHLLMFYLFVCFYTYIYKCVYIVKLLGGITLLSLLGNAYAKIQEELERCTGSLSSRGCSGVRQRFVQSVYMCFVDLEKNWISSTRLPPWWPQDLMSSFHRWCGFVGCIRRWPQARATAVHSSVKQSGWELPLLSLKPWKG